MSSATPAGADVNPGCVGCCEWHGWQRAATTCCTAANVTAVPACAGAGSGGRSQTAIAAIAAAQPTGIHQSVSPAWRLLK